MGKEQDYNTEEINELYIPSGLKMNKEYFPGFGKKELIPSIFSVFIFLIIDCLVFMFGCRNVGIFLFLPVIGVSIVVMMQIKGELNLSPVDIIKLELTFLKEQKTYPYIAKNEWENIE